MNQKKEDVKEKDEASDRKEDESAGWFASWGIPSGITKVVENTTKAVENTVCTLSSLTNNHTKDLNSIVHLYLRIKLTRLSNILTCDLHYIFISIEQKPSSWWFRCSGNYRKENLRCSGRGRPWSEEYN